MKKKSIFSLLLISLFPALLLFYYISRYAIQNIPQLDDYTIVIEFITDFNAAPTFAQKFRVLTAQHQVTEHRLVMAKLVAYLQYLITGEVDFGVMAWIGNLLAVPAFLLLLWKVYVRTELSLWYFIPVPFILFTTQYYEQYTWSNCSLLYFFSATLGMLSVYLAVFSGGRRIRYALSLLSVVACCFTFGNGTFIFASLLVVFLFQHRYRALVGMALVATVCLLFYFSGYHSELETKLTVMAFTNLFGLLGSYIEPFRLLSRLTIPGTQIVGALMLLVMIGYGLKAAVQWASYTFRRQPGRASGVLSPDQLFLLSSLLFILMTGAAVALKRTSDSGIYEMFTSRYRFISICFVALVYVFGLCTYSARLRKITMGALLPTSIILYFSSFYFYHPAIFNGQEPYRVSAFNYRQYGDWNMYPRNEFWDVFVNESTTKGIRRGVYHLPILFSDHYKADLLKQPAGTALQSSFMTVAEDDYRYVLTNTTYQPTQDTNREEVSCLVMKSDDHTFLLPISRNRNGIRTFLTTGDFFGKGFTATLNKNNFPAGCYRLALFERKEGRTKLTPIGIPCITVTEPALSAQ